MEFILMLQLFSILTLLDAMVQAATQIITSSAPSMDTEEIAMQRQVLCNLWHLLVFQWPQLLQSFIEINLMKYLKTQIVFLKI
jgi:hypothetical protein